MIADSLANADLYLGLGPRFRQAFNFLRSTDLDRLPVGKTDLDGASLFVSVQEYTTKPAMQGSWEAHRRYIDLQCIIQGVERIGHALLDRMKPGAYDAAGDLLELSGAGESLRLQAGDFAIFFPHDAHMPSLAADEPGRVRKIVVKIAVE
jgi:YhcH/YjgK/YiaL family protein